MENVTAADIAHARESMQRIVDAVARGELAAGPRLVFSLGGCAGDADGAGGPRRTRPEGTCD